MPRSIIIATLIMTAALSVTAEPPQPSFTAEGLTLSKMAFGTDVLDREIVGQAETFTIGGRVYCWTLLEGGKPGDLVHHVWFHGESEVQSIELAVESASWRTWSYKTLFPKYTGDWRVEIRSEDGKVLGVQAFTVTD
jgi:hypothetical protein